MKHIPLSVPNLKGREGTLVGAAVADEWVSTAGPYVKDFEKAVASYVGSADAVACQSGTAGLHLACMEAGIGAGDLVLVADLTFFATVNPIRYCGADPVFMDCDDTLCMDPLKLREFCENECELRGGVLYEKASGRRIPAVMPVHVFGNLCDMESIMDIAGEFGLTVIEDAAEALGSFWTAGRYAGKSAGTVGDFGVYSFNGNKIITTGGGGMVVAKKLSAMDHMRYVSQQSKDDALRFIHGEVGYNYRLTNLQAALGIAQMEELDGFRQIKKRNYDIYREVGLELLPFREGVEPNYWFYSLMTGGKVEEVMAALKERGIDSRPIWQLMHRLKPYAGCRAYQIERAVYYHSNVLNIPCSTNLSEEDVRYVAGVVREILSEV